MNEQELEELRNELLSYLRSKNFTRLKSALEDINPADIAEMLTDSLDEEEIAEEEFPLIFRFLPKDSAADVFTELDSDLQQQLITSFDDNELREIIEDMYLDDTVDVIEEMPANVVSRILRNVNAETRKGINQILKYPEDSAGSLMNTEYVELKPCNTVREAFDILRSSGIEKETIYICYVTENRKLIGIVSVRDLLIAGLDQKISDIMETSVISVYTVDDKENVAQAFDKYDFTALPVVDKEDRLVGIVTVDDAIDVINEEATEDMEKMAAITPSEHPYLKSKVLEIWKQRIPWLLLLMVSATFTGMIITDFEDALAAQVCLAAFIPMLMDTGGNCGSQASVTVIRGISLGDIEFSDMFDVIWKEFRVSILCSVCLGIVAFGKIMLVDKLIMGNTDITVPVAFVICLSLVFTVVIAKLVGSILPLVAKKLGFDPAVMASPFITTIVDALSLMIYMNFATMILHI